MVKKDGNQVRSGIYPKSALSRIDAFTNSLQRPVLILS